jgi:hypothetical protein
MENNLNTTARQTLNAVLTEQQGFIKAHAAEYLLRVGDTAEVQKTFLREDTLHGTEPRYRIVIWRVLAQTESSPEGKMKWAGKVLAVFGDPEAPDRLHASETLARLGISPLERFPDATRASLQSDNPNLRVYTLWAISFSSDSLMEGNKRKFLDFAAADSLLDIRKISAYILRHIKGLTAQEWSDLAARALKEPAETGFRQNFLNTAYVTFPGGADSGLYEKVEAGMRKGAADFSAEDRVGVAQALAEKGGPDDIPLLTDYLKNKNIQGLYKADSPVGADVRAAAAYAILKIDARGN